MSLTFIATDKAPLPGGHYSQAVSVNGLLFVAGILPFIPNTKRETPTGITAQAEQVFRNLHAILEAAGARISDVASVQIFIPDIAAWEEINACYMSFFRDHKPARTIIPCGPLHYGVALEANAVAAIPKDR